MSRHFGFAMATVVLAASFVGCPLLKKKPTTDDEDPPPVVVDAATVTVSGTGAKNEASVLRYANETPLPNIPAVILKDGTVVRNFPGNGPQVAVLNRGAVVAKIAQYFSSGILIMFDDPVGDGSKLMGWVSDKSFDVAAPPPTRTVIVPPQPTPVVQKDAGTAPTVRDAGAPTVQDAGGGNATVQDAGKGNSDAPPAPRPGQVAVSPVNGKCPWDGWALTEGMCRHKCNADADCVAAGLRVTKCKTKSGTKVCSSD